MMLLCANPNVTAKRLNGETARDYSCNNDFRLKFFQETINTPSTDSNKEIISILV